jgi:hypothetical protein
MSWQGLNGRLGLIYALMINDHKGGKVICFGGVRRGETFEKISNAITGISLG